MEVPGHLGYAILGDKSLEFIRSPRDYISHQRKTHGDVFKGRILNKAHVFITSNRAVEDFLTSEWVSVASLVTSTPYQCRPLA